MLFDSGDELKLSGRTEQVAAYGPGIDDRLQRQSRQQVRRSLGARRISEPRKVSEEDAGGVEGHAIGAMVHSSDSDIALSSCVNTPSRARHPCPSGRKLLMFSRINFSSQPYELLGDVQPDMRKLKTMPRVIAPVMPRVLPRVIQIRALTRSLELVASMAWLGDVRSGRDRAGSC